MKLRAASCGGPSWTDTSRIRPATESDWRSTNRRGLGKGQTEELQAGMVITVEPGIYVPERGGIRIEDMVLVTETGCEVLTPMRKT